MHTESTIQTSESLKHPLTKYVVDGFEVPLSEGSPHPNGSSFIEVSSNHKNKSIKNEDKQFRKRNDMSDVYWTDADSLEGKNVNDNVYYNYKPAINEPEASSYVRHQPQSELFHGQPGKPLEYNPKSFYVYENPLLSAESPYRSRYQHRYQANKLVTQPQLDIPTESPQVLHNHMKSSPYSYSMKPDLVAFQYDDSSKATPGPESVVRRKVPDLYIEVIPDQMVNKTQSPDDYSIVLLDNPKKKLSYEINDRLIAPFKQYEYNQLGRSASSWPIDKEPVYTNGQPNRYNMQPLDANNAQPSYTKVNTIPHLNSLRKKVVRKRKQMARGSQQALAASSSTNLYGHTPSINTYANSFMAHPLSMINMVKPSSGGSGRTHKKVKIQSFNSYSQPLDKQGWKPLAPASSTTTPAPLLSYIESVNNNLNQLTDEQLAIEAKAKTVNRHRKIEYVADSRELVNNDGALTNNEPTSIVLSPPPSYHHPSTPRPPFNPSSFRAHTNRYVTVPLSSFKSTPAKSRAIANVTAPLVKPITKLPQSHNRMREELLSQYLHKIIEFSAQSPPAGRSVATSHTPPPLSTTTRDRPIVDKLEDFIKKTIETEQRQTQDQRTSAPIGYLESPFFPTLKPPTELSKPYTKSYRKVRPAIKLETLSAPSPPTSTTVTTTTSTTPRPQMNSVFVSQRLPVTPAPVMTTPQNLQQSSPMSHRQSSYGHKQSSISLDEPSSIVYYSSPQNNELFHNARINLTRNDSPSRTTTAHQPMFPQTSTAAPPSPSTTPTSQRTAAFSVRTTTSGQPLDLPDSEVYSIVSERVTPSTRQSSTLAGDYGSYKSSIQNQATLPSTTAKPSLAPELIYNGKDSGYYDYDINHYDYDNQGLDETNLTSTVSTTTTTTTTPSPTTRATSRRTYATK